MYKQLFMVKENLVRNLDLAHPARNGMVHVVENGPSLGKTSHAHHSLLALIKNILK